MRRKVLSFIVNPKGFQLELQLERKIALVTGASQGIGRAIAFGLAREGVKTAIVARRGELLRDLAAEIEAAGGQHPTIIEADLANPETPERITAIASERARYINGTVIPVDGGMSKFAF